MEKEKLIFRLNAGIRFNRNIDADKDYVSPGGFNFTMGGKEIEFDFAETWSCIDKNRKNVIAIGCKNPDYEEYPDLESITKEMLSNVTKINEFFVYTGESDETELRPVELTYCYFEIIGENYARVAIPENVIKSAVLCSN